jgi:hypothetical protein
LRSLGLTENEVFERDVTGLINRRALPGDSVLAYEVQARYFLRPDVQILSEDGIIDGKVRPYQQSHNLAAFVLRYRPRWWIADNDLFYRPYLHHTVLQQAFLAFRASPRLRQLTMNGIRFELVARRTRPLAPGFGGWLMLFALSYPQAAGGTASTS